MEADAMLERAEVWADDHWRLTTRLAGQVLGFSYLEPRRHIASIAELDGPEAASFGDAIGRACRMLREASGCEFVYIFVFGGSIPHLHVHLAPHWQGDVLNDQLLRGDIVATPHPSGGVKLTSKDFPTIPEAEHRALVDRLRERFA